MDLQGSAIDIISSIHGRERRAQRAIEKYDLREAVKHGIREETHPCRRTGTPRFKYTYANVVYITNHDGTEEVTSWIESIPLDPFPVRPRAYEQHEAAKRLLRRDPSRITSHSVLVIDMSGSMRKSDVIAHRSRKDAVFYAVATELIAKKLLDAAAGVTLYDVISVIEMRRQATVVLYKEPISWVLHNQIVERSQTERPGDHGTYCPALQAAHELLRDGVHADLALLLLFLSDGRPSDCASQHYQILHHARAIGKEFGEKMTFGMVGYGRADENFTMLESMANCMRLYGAKGTFDRSEPRNVGSLGTTLATMATSLVQTRTLLTTARYAAGRVKHTFTMDVFTRDRVQQHDATSWDIYTAEQHGTKRMVLEWSEEARTHVWNEAVMIDPQASGFMSKKNPFGYGAERLVYQMTEVDQQGHPVGVPLVAKESIYAEKMGRSLSFHMLFCKTQLVAANLAKKFNLRLEQLGSIAVEVPRIEFLPCSVYEFTMDDETYGFLSERQIDDQQYQKWNNNCGGVMGQRQLNQNNVEPTESGVSESNDDQKILPINLNQPLGMIIEENSEDEENEMNIEVTHSTQTEDIVTTKLTTTLDSDVPQAFTHYTYFWTKRKKMVCDLQGVLNTNRSPPVFEFTDPCIHYASSKNRRQVFGRTDRGKKGMYEFFQSHECNNLCKALGISYARKKN